MCYLSKGSSDVCGFARPFPWLIMLETKDDGKSKGSGVSCFINKIRAEMDPMFEGDWDSRSFYN